MINQEQARAVADEVLERTAIAMGLDDLVISRVQEFPVGWTFSYCRRRMLEGNLEIEDIVRYGFAGNAPILVDRRTGKAHVTGTAYEVTHYVAEYEAGRHVCRDC